MAEHSDENAQAIRHPKRGKAHRQLSHWPVTICRPESLSGLRFFETLTETVPVAQTAPEDRCRRCFPPGTAT